MRGSSCFRMSLYTGVGIEEVRGQAKKNKALGGCRVIGRHNPISPSENRLRPNGSPLGNTQVNVRFSHRKAAIISTRVRSQYGLARPAENPKPLWRDRLQPGNAFGSLGRIQRGTSHPSFNRQRILRIQRRETSSTRKHIRSRSLPRLRRNHRCRWERSSLPNVERRPTPMAGKLRSSRD